jgi:hypothetical protein
VQATLAVTVPFFALVLGGYLASRAHVLPESAIPGLNAFVLYFALPCMLFRFGARMPVAEVLNPGVLLVYLASALLIVFFTVTTTLSERVHLKDASFGALVAAFPNLGFMGVPLAVALLGPAAAAPMISMIVTDMFVTTSLCIALAEAHGARGHGAAVALKRALRGAMANPMPWAIAAGVAFSALGITLEGPLAVIVGMLADAASPVALFTIGAVLWRAGQHAHGKTPAADYVPVALIKLLLHPLVVFALAVGAKALGAPLTAFHVQVMTLAAALPSASNVSILAERFGADNGRIARTIMLSTALAFVTVSLLAGLFGVKTKA